MIPSDISYLPTEHQNRGKRPAATQIEHSSGKKIKTINLSVEQIEKLSAEEIYRYLCKENISDNEKMRLLRSAADGKFHEFFFACMKHCDTANPALYCLEKLESPISYNKIKPLDQFRIQLENNFKLAFDYNTLYCALKEKGEKSDLEEYIMVHACNRGLKELVISCIGFGNCAHYNTLMGESWYSLAYKNLPKEDFEEILDLIIWKSGRCFTTNYFKWKKVFGDGLLCRVAALFVYENSSSPFCHPSCRIGAAEILPQKDFDRLYLAFFENLPATLNHIVELNNIDRPKPSAEKILRICRKWAEEKEMLRIMPLIEHVDVYSPMLLFWVDFLAREKTDFFIDDASQTALLKHVVEILRGDRRFLFSQFLVKEKLEFIKVFLGIEGENPKSGFNYHLLNKCFAHAISWLENDGKPLTYAAYSTVYSAEDNDLAAGLRQEFWANHPDDILIRLGISFIKNDKFERLYDFIEILTTENFVTLIGLSHKNPEILRQLILNRCEIIRMEVRTGGGCLNTWEICLERMLKKLGTFEIKLKSPILIELRDWLRKQKFSFATSRITKILPGSWIGDLQEQGWEKVKRFGRTDLYKSNEDGSFMAIKWQSKHETPNDLWREYQITQFFNQRGKELGLMTQFPMPKDFVEFAGDMPEGFFDGWGTTLACVSYIPYRRFAYVYTFADDSYFRYLDDEDLSDEDFQKGLEICLHDLFTLFNENVLMTSLAALFHNNERKSPYVPFPRLISNNWRHDGSGGSIDEWEKLFLNIRKSGLADGQEINFVKETIKEKFGFLDDSDGEHQPEAEAIVLSNYIGEYFLVLELLIGKIFKQRGQLDWQDAEKTKKLAATLMQDSTTAFKWATLFPERVCQGMVENLGRFDVYAKQVAFWLQNDSSGYLPHVENGRRIPLDIDPSVRTSLYPTDLIENWDPDLGFTHDKLNADIGPRYGVNPIKEGEIHRVCMAIAMLSFRKAKEFEKEACDEGRNSWDNQDYQRARVSFEKALKFNPYSQDTWRKLAEVHQKLGNSALAEICLEKSVVND